MTTSDRILGLTSHLEDIDGYANLVFHDIAAGSTDDLWSRFDCTADNLHRIVDRFVETGLASRTRLYFDDNHRSFYDLVLDIDLSRFAEVVAAVPVTSIGIPEKGTTEDLARARHMGARIAAHGHSHVRLADYAADGTRLPTPLRGPYATPGWRKPLSENEVLYQLVESAERIDLFDTGEFVLPYGCYNETTLAINDRLRLFDFLATTDFELDTGQQLRPRLLVMSSDTPELVEQRILAEVENHDE
ncbi:hypothetical protein [Nocardia brasiliensis]|uniref:hypothetical protein n=1 Tax=Nocardia brasiliensis TaxID=37326 RepID=UPI002455131B|nr:hypothetical protein [Nocardia brasiliensis]